MSNRIAVLLLVAACPAAQAGEIKLFDANPAHPWNRLYAAMWSNSPAVEFRVPRAPAEWQKPDERLVGKEYMELRAALDAFIDRRAEKLFSSPTRRALLQSALWATFDQVSDPRGHERARRLEIARRCAEVIRRLAMSDAEIAALPDSYALTTGRGTYAADYDAEQPERIFLPGDLLDTKGPWVMLLHGDYGVPAAIQHVQAVQGRAVFYVFIKLPSGRAATLEYLRTLANYPQPYEWNKMYPPYPNARRPVVPSSQLPQFPQGTQVALMRRMILTNDRGDLVVTPVTQSLQIRVYAKDPMQTDRDESGNQVFHELRLAPVAWLSNGDGLVAHRRQVSEPLMTFEEPSMLNFPNCRSCHGNIGIHSVQTYTGNFGPPRTTPWFEPTTQEWQDRNTLEWKRKDFSWGLLQGFLATKPPRPTTAH